MFGDSNYIPRDVIYILNGVLLLCGFACIASGAMHLGTTLRCTDAPDTIFPPLIIPILVFGTCLLGMAILGIMAAFSMHPGLLQLYAILLTAVALVITGCAVATFIYLPQTESIIDHVLYNYVSYNKHVTNYRRRMDSIQNEFECCGAYGPQDYRYSRIPLSCYDDGKLETRGCVTVLSRRLKLLTMITGGFAATSGAVSLITAALSAVYRKELLNNQFII